MNGADLYGRGTWLCSVLVTRLNSSAFLELQLCDPTSVPLFKRGYCGCLFMTIDVGLLMKDTRISLEINNQFIHVEVMLLPKLSVEF